MWMYTVVFGELRVRGMAGTKEKAEEEAKAAAEMLKARYPDAPLVPVIDIHKLPDPDDVGVIL